MKEMTMNINPIKTKADYRAALKDVEALMGSKANTADGDPPAPLPKNRIALASALITFIALFVYVPLFAHLEKWTGDHPNVIETIKKVELQSTASLFSAGRATFLRQCPAVSPYPS